MDIHIHSVASAKRLIGHNMKAPDIKRIAKEDYPSQYQDLIDKLAFPLNSFMEQVKNILSGNVDFDNLTREVITLRIQTDNTSKPISLPTFKSKLTRQIIGLIPISLRVLSSTNVYPSQAPFISFSQSGTIVTLNNIAGLAPETSYELLLETIS